MQKGWGLGKGRFGAVAALLRVAVLAAVLPLLGGCAIPPAVTVAKLVGDGLLALTTGKTSTDHGLSLVTGQDCLTFRVLNGERICVDDTGPVLAVVEPPPPRPQALAAVVSPPPSRPVAAVRTAPRGTQPIVNPHVSEPLTAAVSLTPQDAPAVQAQAPVSGSPAVVAADPHSRYWQSWIGGS